VDIVPVDLSEKFSLTSPTHLVAGTSFLKTFWFYFWILCWFFSKFHCLLTKMQVHTR